MSLCWAVLLVINSNLMISLSWMTQYINLSKVPIMRIILNLASKNREYSVVLLVPVIMVTRIRFSLWAEMPPFQILISFQPKKKWEDSHWILRLTYISSKFKNILTKILTSGKRKRKRVSTFSLNFSVKEIITIINTLCFQASNNSSSNLIKQILTI
jgi:hypothetical protein